MAIVREGGAHRKAMTVQVVGGVEQQRNEVRRALESSGDRPLEVSESAPDSTETGTAQPDLAMVIFDQDEAGALGYLQSHSVAPSHPQQFALMHEPPAVLMRRALRAGADEILFLPLHADEVDRELLKFSERQRKHGAAGYICLLTSLTGGVGITTLSGNLALALNYALDKRVAVVDLNLQNSGMSVFLHLQPAQTMVALAELSQTLDSLRLEAALTKHPSGVYLLAAPKCFEEAARITPEMVGTILDLMRQLFDYVVIDGGPHVDENTVAALGRADELLYVVDQSLSSARIAARFMEWFSRLGFRGVEPRVVVNRFDAQSEVTLAEINKRGGRAAFATIPRDERGAERLQLHAEDLWQLAPRSDLARAMENLAGRLTSPAESREEPSANFVARLLTSIGARAAAG
jgi:pilus assembly protein CpaE